MHTLQITLNQVLKQCCGIIKFCRKDHGGNDVRLVTCLDVSRSPIAIKNRRFYFSFSQETLLMSAGRQCI